MKASLLPIFPKQTQLQKRTLAIQVDTPMPSFETKWEDPFSAVKDLLPETALEDAIAGEGTMSGLIPRRVIVPRMPTLADKTNPVLERSIKYQSTGLAKASVRDTCNVDCHGSFLWCWSKRVKPEVR